MAITFTYDESANKVILTEGTFGTPADFDDFVTWDRAGTAELTTEDTPAAFTQASTLSLAYPMRPVENKALILTFVITGSAGLGAGDTLDISGDDWDGNNQTESIVIAAGDGTYVSTKKYSTVDASGITFTDNAGGGFSGDLKITQPQWGVIWDYGSGTYQIDAFFEVGDNGTETFFADNRKHVFWPSYFALPWARSRILVTDLASFELGLVQNASEKSTYGGCSLIDHNTSSNYWRILSGADGAIVNLYSCSFRSMLSSGVVRSVGTLYDSKVWNCIFDRVNTGSCDTTDFFNDTISAVSYPISTMVNCTFDNIKIFGSQYCMHRGGTFSNMVIRDVVGGASYGFIAYVQSQGEGDVTIIDGDCSSWLVGFDPSITTDKHNRKNTVNISVIDSAGTAIENAAVEMTDSDGNTTGGFASVNTGADGAIAEQTVTRGYCSKGDDNLDNNLTKDYSPHRLEISKTGYETLIFEDITINQKITWWNIELQPATGLKKA